MVWSARPNLIRCTTTARRAARTSTAWTRAILGTPSPTTTRSTTRCWSTARNRSSLMRSPSTMETSPATTARMAETANMAWLPLPTSGVTSTRMPSGFQHCPNDYCCTSRNCETYDGCANHRHGRLCGLCRPGYSEALFSSVCVPDDTCHNNGWLVPLDFRNGAHIRLFPCLPEGHPGFHGLLEDGPPPNTLLLAQESTCGDVRSAESWCPPL